MTPDHIVSLMLLCLSLAFGAWAYALKSGVDTLKELGANFNEYVKATNERLTTLEVSVKYHGEAIHEVREHLNRSKE